MSVSPAHFVAIWQSANSVEEVAAATGMLPGSASGRASSYRRKGIRLKIMKRDDPKKLDVNQLNRIVDASESSST